MGMRDMSYAEMIRMQTLARKGPPVNYMEQRFNRLVAQNEEAGMDRHWQWYIHEWDGLQKRQFQLAIESLELGYPILVQQLVENRKIGEGNGSNKYFTIPHAVKDNSLSEWDEKLTISDVIVREDSTPVTVSRIAPDVDITRVELASAPADDSVIDASFSFNYTDLNSIHAADNGSVIYVYPESWGASGAYRAVLVFMVPSLKSNTRIKGRLRMASDVTNTTFVQRMYDFNTSTWDVLTTSEFSPDSADTDFTFYEFYATSSDYISDDNLLALEFSGFATGEPGWAGYYIDYAWAWLDRTSGWF